MRGLAILVAGLAALAVVSPAAAKQPRLALSDRAAINATLDVFVNHAVKRRNVGASYDVVTETMKGGMTREQWSRGDIPVYPYPAAGRYFHEWTVQYRTKDEVAIELILAPTARYEKKLGQFLFHVYLQPKDGRWLVDSIMPGATFAPVGERAVVQAGADYTGNPSAQTYNRNEKEERTRPIQISSRYIVLPFAVLGLLLGGLAAWGVTRWIRYRRLDVPGGLPPLSIPTDGARARPSHRQ